MENHHVVYLFLMLTLKRSRFWMKNPKSGTSKCSVSALWDGRSSVDKNET